jgi:16S rRNA (cytidine1402-2'-O)-methyltransferase
LNELKEISEGLSVVVCREMTKKFETIYRGKIRDVIDCLQKDKILGEFVVVIEGKK